MKNTEYEEFDDINRIFYSQLYGIDYKDVPKSWVTDDEVPEDIENLLDKSTNL